MASAQLSNKTTNATLKHTLALVAADRYTGYIHKL